MSTVIFVWDIYKWQKSVSPKLVIRANGNLQEANSKNPQTYIGIKVINTGNKPTTINWIALRYYKTKQSRWRKQKADKRGFFNELIRPTAPLPHKLDVGEEWSGLILQTEDIEKLSREGFLYFEVEDSSTSNVRAFSKTRFLLDE